MKPSALRLLWGPQLMLALLPGLLAPKGCYFGAEKVPLGGNFADADADAGAGPAATDECGGASGADGGARSANGGAPSAGSDGTGPNSNPGVGGMHPQGVFQTH
jgi:hypothetical protein